MTSTTTRSSALLLFALALLFVSSSPVQAQTTSTKIPFSFSVFVPCANGGEGEVVSLSGTLHFLNHISVDANGCVTMKSHAQPQQLTGTGSVTGALYQGTGVTQSTTKEKTNCGDGCTVEVNFNNNFKIIGQGPGNNFMVHMNSRVIYNYCTEETTVVTENSSTECF